MFPNKRLRVCASKLPNFVDLQNPKGKWIMTENGFVSRIFLTIVHHFGWRYELTVLPLHTMKIVNGSWRGCINRLQNNLSDVYIPAELNVEKCDFVDRSLLFLDTVSFFVRSPESVSTITAPIKPFTREVWIMIAVTLLLGSGIFYVVTKVTSNIKGDAKKALKLRRIFTEFFNSLLGNGISFFDRVNGSSAVFALAWSLTIFIITYGYSGALISFIAFPGLEFVPRNYPQLLTAIEENLYNGSTWEYSTIWNFIVTSKQGISKRMDEMRKEGLITANTPEEGMLAVAKGKHAYIVYKILGKILMKTDADVDVLVSEDSLFTSAGGLMMRRGSLLAKRLRQSIQRYFEAGIINKFMEDHIENLKSKHPRTRHRTEWHALNMKDMYGPFCILVTGYVFGAISLIIEIMLSVFANKIPATKNSLY